jgi:ubiquinone/menaquinone biosynthesis C-methylase UbiE
MNPCQKPTGWLGRLVLWNMNWRHSKVTDWGLSHISIEEHDTILDVGCGGGRTVSKLAAFAPKGKVCGIDFSKDSVAMASRINRKLIDAGRVQIREASVSQLPFPDDMFDLVTAVETHFWWPNLPTDILETLRVLKPGGTLIIIAEIYKGADTPTAKLAEKHLPLGGMALLSVNEHREFLSNAGCSNIQVIEEKGKGWICAMGRKPIAKGSISAAMVTSPTVDIGTSRVP